VIADVGDRVAVATRATAGLGLGLLDPMNGALGRIHGVERAQAVAGDLGSIGHIVELDGAIVGFGETGRESVGGKSHTIEPFSLALRGDGKSPERRQLADVVGSIAGVGRLGAQAAFVVNAMHISALYGGTSLPHRGVYVGVAGASGPPRFIPVYQVEYANDDWENGTAHVVTGTPLHARAAHAAGDLVVIAGSCGERGRVGCVIALRHTVDRASARSRAEGR